MARYYPHPRDFICIRENENTELDACGSAWYRGSWRVPPGKIFVPTAIGSTVWIESTPGTAEYTPGQAWGLMAAISYSGGLGPCWIGPTTDFNTYNHVASTDMYCGVYGAMTSTFQAAGKFKPVCTMTEIPFGIFYRGGTEIILRGGPKVDADAEQAPPGTPPEQTDFRLYGFLCDN